ncbi:MAG TPA: cell wall hydrolase [Alphaproteobacteria bacterium]|nr:cell wall hydrolase [Alphaproteobacteria bacterium]
MRWPLSALAFCISLLATIPSHEAVSSYAPEDRTPPLPTWPVVTVDRVELHCLTMNIYYEARGEAPEGQLAVAHVTLNRSRAHGFARTICDVVYQRNAFSWTGHRKGKKAAPFDDDAWSLAAMIARLALSGLTEDPTGGATDFHAASARPSWVADKALTAEIGHHRFYVRSTPPHGQANPG